jgi:hypothetical protein
MPQQAFGRVFNKVKDLFKTLFATIVGIGNFLHG